MKCRRRAVFVCVCWRDSLTSGSCAGRASVVNRKNRTLRRKSRSDTALGATPANVRPREKGVWFRQDLQDGQCFKSTLFILSKVPPGEVTSHRECDRTARISRFSRLPRTRTDVALVTFMWQPVQKSCSSATTAASPLLEKSRLKRSSKSSSTFAVRSASSFLNLRAASSVRLLLNPDSLSAGRLLLSRSWSAFLYPRSRLSVDRPGP